MIPDCQHLNYTMTDSSLFFSVSLKANFNIFSADLSLSLPEAEKGGREKWFFLCLNLSTSSPWPRGF